MGNTTQQKKIITISVVGVLLLVFALLLFILNRQANLDNRGRASTPVVEENFVDVNFSQIDIPVYKKGKFSVDVTFRTDKPVSSATIYVRYPKNLITLDTVASRNISDTCRKSLSGPILDQTLVVSDDSGLVKISKVSLAADAELPKGTFCFATLVFDVRDDLNQSIQYANFNFENNLGSWQILSNGTALKPKILQFPVGNSPYFFFCLTNSQGDADCNNFVDLEDFERFRTDFIKYKNSTLTDNTYITTDFNRDLKIDIGDFSLFRSGFIFFARNPRPTPTSTPPTGCYYQQVQCIKAPCPPILVCPTVTPTQVSCNWCGSLCLDSDAKRLCPDGPIPANSSCVRQGGVCQILPKTTVTVISTPSATPPMSCSWCGTTCGPTQPGQLCPAVMPPGDKECKLVTGSCKVVDKTSI